MRKFTDYMIRVILILCQVHNEIDSRDEKKSYIYGIGSGAQLLSLICQSEK